MWFSKAFVCLLFVGIAYECSEDSSFGQSLAGAFIENGSYWMPCCREDSTVSLEGRPIFSEHLTNIKVDPIF
jgi:hypothetical protein